MILKINNKKYGAYLKEKREKAEMTQRYAGKKLGLTSGQFLSNAERGKCTLPLDVLRDLLRLYGVNPEEFISLMMEDYTEMLTKELISQERSKKK